MPVTKHLRSSEPQAFGKNALLQKQFELQYRRIEKEQKTIQREIRSNEEKCVTSIYALLLEAEAFEKEKRRKEKEEDEKRRRKLFKRREIFYYENKDENEKKEDVVKPVKGRPMTSMGHDIRTKRKTESKRPESAHPALCADRRRSMGLSVDDEKHVLKDLLTFNKPKMERNKNDMSEYNTKNVEKVWQIQTKRLMNVQKFINSIKQESTKRKDSVTELLDSESQPKTKPETAIVKQRPKTADFYRKKRPDDELSEYYNRRVSSLLSRWNMEDSDDSVTRLSVSRDFSQPPFKRKHSQSGSAELKTKSFLHKYSGTYRSLLRPSSAPATEIHQKRSEKITRQELASIHADVAKHRKNTKALLNKSKHLKLYVQNLPGVTSYD